MQGVPRGLLDSLRAGHTVLAPNAELARALFEAVERSHRDEGSSCWPTPRIQDFASWLRAQHARRQLPELSTDAAHGQGAGALRGLNEVEEQELWRRVVLESDFAADFLEPAGAAAAARRARRIMVEYGIPVAALAAHPSDEANALAAWIARFEARCRALACISGDSLLASFAGSPEPIAWIETPEWTPTARRWLQRHAGTQLMPFRRVAAAACCILHAASPDLELAAMAEWAMRHLQADAGFRAWLCVPDLAARRAEVSDAFDAALAPQRYGLPVANGRAAYAMAGGTALAELSPVRAALEFLTLAVGPVPFARFSALLRAPDYQATATDAARAAALDLALRRVAPSELPLTGWLALANLQARELSPAPVAALDHLNLALRLLTELRDQQLPSRWVRLWAQAFEAGPWVHRRRWSSDEFQAAERLRELWSTLAAADQVLGSQSRQAAVRLLLTAARDTPFQAQTGIPPIWISGTVMDPWLGYDALWIAGVAEERWPPPAAPVSLLPIALQRRFDVPAASPDMQLAAARELQTRWLVRAASVAFSFAASSAARSAVASPLLPPDSAPPGNDDLRAASQPHWRRARRSLPNLERLIDERGPGFAAPERTRGVDSLRAQSLCAFRGFATTRLRSEELRMPIPGFSPAERGELVHATLQTVWENLQSSAALATIEPAALTALVDGAAATAIAAVCRVRDPGRRWRLREQTRLRTLIEQWLDVERRRLPFAIERLESAPVVAHFAGLEFNCRVDRVDRLDDGARIVIDYKTSLLNADWRGERPLNPQLPVYALLNPENLVAVAYGQVNISDCRFVAESERPALFAPKSKVTPLENCRDFTELLQVWAQRVERLAQNLRDGHAEVSPLPQACSTCHLQGLCRISTTPSEAEARDE